MPKKCFKCGEVKALSMFYRHSMMADGHLNKCKECTKKDVRKHRQENESVREYDRMRAKEKRRMEAHKKRTSEYKKANRERVRANAAVKRAVDKGLLSRLSCEQCGNKNTVGHHDDYSKPLVVRWLCQRCHMKHHHGKND